MKHTLIPLVLAVALGSGCMHTNTKLPGVLDLRSDGSDAATNTEAFKSNEEITRSGFGAVMWGDGLQITGDKVVLQDRQWFVVGLLPVFNDQLEAEYKALPAGTALRSVTVGDSLSLLDLGTWIGGAFIAAIPIITIPVAWVIEALPHNTVTVTGTRIQSSGGGGAVEPPPPTDGTPPADPNAPATTAPGT